MGWLQYISPKHIWKFEHLNYGIKVICIVHNPVERLFFKHLTTTLLSFVFKIQLTLSLTNPFSINAYLLSTWTIAICYYSQHISPVDKVNKAYIAKCSSKYLKPICHLCKLQLKNIKKRIIYDGICREHEIRYLANDLTNVLNIKTHREIKLLSCLDMRWK